MKYYCIKQHDITDCGAACLATICKQNGYKIGITQIREVAGTDKQGTISVRQKSNKIDVSRCEEGILTFLLIWLVSTIGY